MAMRSLAIKTLHNLAARLALAHRRRSYFYGWTFESAEKSAEDDLAAGEISCSISRANVFVALKWIQYLS